MKRFPIFALVVSVVLIVACAAPGMAAPTATPAPTNTAEPTVTPLPTETPTLVPTSTPDTTATAAAVATETADAVLTELDKLLGDTDIAYKEGHLVWQQAKPMSVNLHGPSADYMEVGQNLTAGDFILKSDVIWNATGLLACGVTFRSEPNLEQGKQYQFIFLRFSGLPAWAIEVHEYGQFQNSPTKIQYSAAVDQGNDATNQIVLIARGEQFNLYINKVSQGRYFDYSKQRMDGTFALLAVQESGDGSCEFENSWIWSLDKE
jgi:hypothetical protein